MEVKKVNGNLVITVPLVPLNKAPLSASQKNKILYSSGGFADAGDFRISLNVIPAKK